MKFTKKNIGFHLYIGFQQDGGCVRDSSATRRLFIATLSSPPTGPGHFRTGSVILRRLLAAGYTLGSSSPQLTPTTKRLTSYRGVQPRYDW